MNKFRPLVMLLIISTFFGKAAAAEKKTTGYAGSVSCRECHDKFYQLWSTSYHGLAMQPYTAGFAKKSLKPQAAEVKIGKFSYRADISGSTGWVREWGPGGEKKYRIEQALGGKNVYYFLTPFEKGRLQTLPVAFDVLKKEWFDTAASGIRHFPGGETGQQVDWKDPAYTFNTSCHGCHVSQLSTNYDFKTDTYTTTWAEPGINCEACHGPSAEHNRVLRGAPKGQKPEDIRIISWKTFTAEQKNAACSICHAKMSPVTSTFVPGDRFFNHFDLATLEDPDFYPDGRDLGENYTYTSWMLSPCAKAGKLHCVTCHTPSGRYRFKTEKKANDACMPCHENHVKNATEHNHHQQGSTGNKCISCHMPMTSFARMNRTDHSMLPPTPAATIAYQSPNACNLCHTDKNAGWADKCVREWRTRDYQAPVLERAALIDWARKRDWKQLPAMLDYITNKGRDEIFATSLIRLVQSSGDQRVAPVLLEAVRDPSPLVRSAAAAALQNVPTKEAVQALVEATGDDYRLVRVRAAASLAGYRNLPLGDAQEKTVAAANEEYLASILSRPDQWASLYNLGNYYLDRLDFKQAVVSYDKALKLEPQAVLAMVNESMAYARMGENKKADESLKKALKVAPDNAAANFNMGLRKAEENDSAGAEMHLRAALKADPQMAQAAYNLCVVLSRDHLNEAVGFCRQAAELRRDMPKYAYTLAFFQQQTGDTAGATAALDDLIARYPAYVDAYLLLGEIYEQQGDKAKAEEVYKQGLAADGVPVNHKLRMKARLDALKLANTGSGTK
ncbi:MAG TPA: tetratricopeptide repeat protein [Deltaproteobacteria bacterium]|jgi:tetratricopeptide (TPR) repeat protein|nr:tetratricopeptide repeat protein [Deltaproteobacteria bacterium]